MEVSAPNILKMQYISKGIEYPRTNTWNYHKNNKFLRFFNKLTKKKAIGK